jgi:5'-nucleotidase, C-terminal domain
MTLSRALPVAKDLSSMDTVPAPVTVPVSDSMNSISTSTSTRSMSPTKKKKRKANQAKKTAGTTEKESRRRSVDQDAITAPVHTISPLMEKQPYSVPNQQHMVTATATGAQSSLHLEDAQDAASTEAMKKSHRKGKGKHKKRNSTNDGHESPNANNTVGEVNYGNQASVVDGNQDHRQHRLSQTSKKKKKDHHHRKSNTSKNAEHSNDIVGSTTRTSTTTGSHAVVGARIAFDGSISPASSTGSMDDTTPPIALTDVEMGQKVVEKRRKGKKRSSRSPGNKHNEEGKEKKGADGLTKDGAPHNDKVSSGCRPRSCTRRTAILCTILFVVVAAAVIVPCYFFLDLWQGDDNTNEPSDGDGFPRIVDVPPETVVSQLPVDVCNEWVPGSMYSEDCTTELTLEHGGLLCNLVAKSMLNTTYRVDLALINAGTCLSDLRPSEVTAGDILDVILADAIVILEIAGTELEKLLVQATEMSFGPVANPAGYPYSSGMRFSVEANLPPYERISKIEVNPRLEGDWLPLNPRRFYRVATTRSLSLGHLGYGAFTNVVDDWKRGFTFQTTDTFFEFISNQESWWDLPESEYSTQYFVGEKEEKIVASVPVRICSADIPGGPKTSNCSEADVANGSGVCNLVAWAIYDQAPDDDVDFVLVMADLCGDDIPNDVGFGTSIASTTIKGDPPLVTMNVPGQIVRLTIEEAIDAALGSRPGAYPYAAGLRFSVDARQSFLSRVSNMEFLDREGGGWVAFDPSTAYKILTLADIAIGRDDAFASILNADTSSIKDIGPSAKEMLLSYAEDWQVLNSPPPEKSSTQLYIS